MKQRAQMAAIPVASPAQYLLILYPQSSVPHVRVNGHTPILTYFMGLDNSVYYVYTKNAELREKERTE